MLANGNFAEGDEILVRFRLFADQLAHGWGWAIDNLFIQSPVTSAENPASAAFSIYPMPVHDVLYLVLNSNVESLVVEVLDLQGKVVFKDILHANNDSNVNPEVDVGFLSEGLYIIKATTKGKTYVRKFIKNP